MMLCRTLSFFLMLSAAIRLCAASGKSPQDPAFQQIASILQTLSQISGLTEEHPVAYGRMDKAQLRRFLAKRIKKSVNAKDIRKDELALKMLGLVPQDFDLRKSTLDLITEQAAAFYDYDSKKLYLLDSDPPSEQSIVLAHELSHALADQHFNLGRFLDEQPANDDEDLARTAVAEGEASWLMIAYDLKLAGRPPVPTPRMLESMLDSSGDAGLDSRGNAGGFPVLKSSPLYVRESLLFPYTEGALFFDAVFKKMGKQAFAEVFRDPPVDSAQIMQPEKYFLHVAPLRPRLPKLRLRKSKLLAKGALGEFDHDILLRQYLGKKEAHELSPHLLGGAFAILTVGRQHKPVLEYASAWDTTGHAARFFSAYKRILRKKWTRCESTVSNRSVFAGGSGNGFFVARLTGNYVISIEGLPDRRAWITAQEVSDRSK